MEGTSADALQRLVSDGLLSLEAGRHRTTRRWQAAMARVALRLIQQGADDDDLRLPVACALVEFYGDLPNAEIIRLVEVLTPIEAAEIDPRIHIRLSQVP